MENKDSQPKELAPVKHSGQHALEEWVKRSEIREQLMIWFNQPMTARQFARRLVKNRKSCSAALRALAKHGLTHCLNPSAKENRVYWLTTRGRDVQRRLRKNRELQPLVIEFPEVDWDLYGWASFRHRAAIIKNLDGQMQPAHIRRFAHRKDPHLRMSANNVRDIMPTLVDKGIVRKVKIRKRAHWHYELTELGEKLRVLLLHIEIV